MRSLPPFLPLWKYLNWLEKWFYTAMSYFYTYPGSSSISSRNLWQLLLLNGGTNSCNSPEVEREDIDWLVTLWYNGLGVEGAHGLRNEFYLSNDLAWGCPSRLSRLHYAEICSTLWSAKKRSIEPACEDTSAPKCNSLRIPWEGEETWQDQEVMTNGTRSRRQRSASSDRKSVV